MKEYLTKNSNGEYQLVNHRFSEDDIEIPDGANAFLRIGNGRNYFYRFGEISFVFYEDGRREIIQDGIKTAEEFVCYDNLDNDIILWQREKIEVGEAGKKFDSGKSRFSLLPKGAVNKIIDVLEFGAKKYTVIDFYDRITIGKIIENRIWLSMPSVSSAGITKEFSPRVVVQNAIERSSIKYLHALAVKKRSLSQQKMEDVVLVTSLKELPNALWNLKLNKNISELTENHQILKKGSERESESDAVILNTEKSKVNAQESETLRGTDSLCRNMSVFVSEDVQYAEVKNVHTLTTTIVQGNSETCFVVSAIKLSDCYKSLLILLEHYYSTSININEIGTVVQGANNWQEVDNAEERYYNAAMRHIDLWWNGEKRDPETGIHHLAHAATNLFFLMWFDNK